MYKYTAVIIEPRPHKALEFVLRNFFTNLSDEWGFIIFHGNKNKDFIYNLFDTSLKEYKNRVYRLIQLNVDNLSGNQYNILCKSVSFYKCIDTEIILLFQTDSIILDKSLLYNYLEYDYVGAPWQNGMVGNGGLSLRRKSKMIEICEKVDPSYTLHEDNYFCYQNAVLLNKPSYEKAKSFSIETVFHEKSFGIHNAWRYLNKNHMDFLINKYPDIAILIELNK
jgi:hypothetical protein